MVPCPRSQGYLHALRTGARALFMDHGALRSSTAGATTWPKASRSSSHGYVALARSARRRQEEGDGRRAHGEVREGQADDLRLVPNRLAGLSTDGAGSSSA